MVYGHNKGVIPLEFDLSPAIGLDLLLLVGDVLLLTKVRRVRNSPIPIEQQCLEKLDALVSVEIFTCEFFVNREFCTVLFSEVLNFLFPFFNMDDS